MSDRTLEQAAVDVLRKYGFKADLIEETTSPTPDIRATDDEGISYLIEIKNRTVGWLDKAEPAWSESEFEVLHRVDSGGASNTLSGVIEKAAEQLGVDNRPDTLRLIWFVVDPTDRDYHHKQIWQTVYGTQIVIAKGRAPGEGFYLSPAAFVRWRNSLDGVILGVLGGLFLNDLSPRYK